MLSDEELSYAFDAVRLRHDLAGLVRRRYGDDPLSPGTTATSTRSWWRGCPSPATFAQEIARTATSLLALCGLSSMIPGSTGPEMAAVAAPVFLGAGARDITGPPHDIPRAFCGSNDITLFVLRDAGHNHNVAPNRHQLWNRLASWMTALSSPQVRRRPCRATWGRLAPG